MYTQQKKQQVEQNDIEFSQFKQKQTQYFIRVLLLQEGLDIFNFMISQVVIDRQARSKNITSLQLQLSVGSAVAKWNKLASRSKNRYLRFKELYMTQIDYQKDLITIRDNIKKPLLQAGIINENEANTMFANVQAMIQLSAQLKEQLEIKFNKWDRRKTEIGKTMTKFSKFMLVYSDYFKNLATTQAKIKTILSHSQKARQIEKMLSSSTKIVTIEDLISKPFQRPLKYHLILRDYQSKTPKDHIDMANLKQAIQCYHKVNQKNNISMENKQKDEVLIALDAKFGNIIEGNTRAFIAQYQAYLIDQNVDLFLFSDLLIIAYKGMNSPRIPIRIHLDKYSYVERPGDGRCFVNRLFIYGKRTCVHLTFVQQEVRNNFEQVIGQVITSTNINQAQRQKRINEGNRFTRNTLIERRSSFTQLKPQTKRPFIITVLGNDKRVFSEDRSETYFVLEITATPSVINQNCPPKQVALVSSFTIQKLVELTKRLYPKVLFYPLDYCPKGFNPKDVQKDIDKRLQIQNLFLQLFLNTIYRDASTSKRLDIYSYYLNFSDTIWEQLKTPNTCALTNCQACALQIKFKNYNQFFNQSRRRYLEKFQLSNNRIVQNRNKMVQFCDRKTIQVIEAIQQIPSTAFNGLPLQTRLEWLKGQFGWINHNFTNPKPTTVRINVKVYFCNVLNSSDGIDVQFFSSQKVKQILNYIGERLKINLEDYTLIAEINGNSYLLWEDEQLGKLLAQPPKQQGLFSGFFAKQPYRIYLWLRKIWYFPTTLEIKCTERKLQHKTEQIIFRLKYGEIKLRDAREYCKVYAWYYCFKHFIELDTLSYYLVKKRTEELDKMLPQRMRQRIIDGLYAEIEKIKSNKSIIHQNQLAEMVLSAVLANDSGSCFFYDTVLKPDNIRVKIGCDSDGIKVRDRSALLFNFQFSLPNLLYYTNGYQFIVTDEKTYSFYSNDSWKLKKQADLYRKNYNSFKL